MDAGLRAAPVAVEPGTGSAFAAAGAMLAQHTLSSMTKAAIPVAAPLMLPALGLAPGFLGVLMATISLFGFVTMLGVGCFVRRFGGLRMGQAALVLNGVFTLLLLAGVLPVMLFCAAGIGVAVGISTPAGSQVVARQSPPRLAPLMFSIKQTAVPICIMTSGLLVPALAAVGGWEASLVAIAAGCAILLFLLQPLRRWLDADRDPAARLTAGDILATVRGVFGHPEIRELGVVSFGFLGLQAAFSAFFVAYLTGGLDYPLATAGTILSASMLVAVVTRVLWGWVAGRCSPRLVLAIIGISSGLLTATLVAGHWSIAMVTVLGVGISATALAWHGVLLAEVARVAPPGTAGAMCGGAIAIGLIGEVTFPLVMGGLLALTGSYAPGFLVAAAAAFVCGAMLLRGGPADRGRAR